MKICFAALLVMTVSGCSCHTIEPGNKGVYVSWGELKETPLNPGFNFLGPGSDIHEVSIRSHKESFKAECFSSDLQQVKLQVAILYRIPEAQVIKVYKEYKGEPFEVLVAPRAQEALKETTASRSAVQIVHEREAVKQEALAALRKKVGDILLVEDLIVENIDLSTELEKAIEQKMVQEQEAAKSKFTKQKAEIDAETALVKAQGEANSSLAMAEAAAKAIKIRGDALAKNPAVIQLELINKWDGHSPTIVSGSGIMGTNILLPAAASPAK